MALMIVFQNDATGTNKNANYNIAVLVGDGTQSGSQVLWSGRHKGHNRKDGWKKLVQEWLTSLIDAPAVTHVIRQSRRGESVRFVSTRKRGS